MTILTKNQTKQFRKDLPNGNVLVAHVRFDDCCNNGCNSFAITCDTYEPYIQRNEPKLKHENGKTVWLSACGCQHDLVREHFPELAPFIKWHLMSTDGPMHYLANVRYWIREGNLSHARDTAVWPDATAEQLSDETLLVARIPRLLADFQNDVESLGFVY